MSTKQMEAEGGASAVLLEVVTRVPAILLASHYAGLAFQRARLPRISGNLTVGVLAGQHVLGLLTKLVTAKLAVVDNLCLAVIGVAAGAELHVADIRKNPRPTLVMTACITSFTWVFVFLAFLAVGRQLTFLADLSSAHVIAVASLVATLGVARSPASAIAVVREMRRPSGPFCSQVMAVTVVKDVLVIVLFAVNLELIALSGLRFHPHTTTVTVDADAGAVADVFAPDAPRSHAWRRRRVRATRAGGGVLLRRGCRLRRVDESAPPPAAFAPRAESRAAPRVRPRALRMPLRRGAPGRTRTAASVRRRRRDGGESTVRRRGVRARDAVCGGGRADARGEPRVLHARGRVAAPVERV